VEVYRAISGGRTDVPKDYSTFQTQRNFEKKKLKTSNTEGKIFCVMYQVADA